MSGLINKLLDDYRGPKSKPKELTIKHETVQGRLDPLSIPGVVKASEAKCLGTHYMNRVNCGKPECPWA